MDHTLPIVLAGPVLRRLEANRVVMTLAVRARGDLRLWLQPVGHTERLVELPLDSPGNRAVTLGEHLVQLLIDAGLDEPLPLDTPVNYHLELRVEDEPDTWQAITARDTGLHYPDHSGPFFVVASRLQRIIHGSCRKPHHGGPDALVAVDALLAASVKASSTPDGTLDEWPSALLMTGDQIYADDVAGPMLRTIHALAHKLGLPNERFDDAEVEGFDDAAALYAHPDGYYRRERLLPKQADQSALDMVLFRGTRKPVFTADSARNHLMTTGEVALMYLLVWSPIPWTLVRTDPPPGLTDAEQVLYEAESGVIAAFSDGLAAVRRAFAHLPVAMIFDDHDVTDDWNLNRAWEETAYGHPFSRRIIGNALLGYLVNQAWGNDPDAFPGPMLDRMGLALHSPGSTEHDTFIDELLRFEGWGYEWPTDPPLFVLDTRTRRWRSESSPHRPSGLIDWESIIELQHRLRDLEAVVLVSAAPIFGVKLIEFIQRLFTLVGHPLLVDAENWMAHPGTASSILNVFRHPATPRHFVILSGDVHYSFVYDVELRGRRGGPDIWQICSSGIKNAFPARLLDVLDRANRWLYSPRSPLNWFTRRRRMRVTPRKPRDARRGRRLLNACGVGVVELDTDGTPIAISEILADGTMIAFTRREAESRWE